MQGIFAGRTQLRYPYGRYGYTRGGGKIWHGGMDLVGSDSTDIRMPYYKNKRITGKVVRARRVTDHSNKTWEWGWYVCVQLDNYYINCTLFPWLEVAYIFVQHQTVDQAVVQTCRSAVFNINPVCRDDLVRMCHQRVRNGENAAVFVVRAELRHRVLGAACVLGDLHERSHYIFTS